MNETGNAKLRKIMLVVTEDWFAASHFKPLLVTLREFCAELVIVTRCSGRQTDLAALGARVVHFPFHRRSLNPLEQGRAALRLSKIVAAERPDVVHLVALVPIVIGSVAMSALPRPGFVAHVTGLGHIATADSLNVRLTRRVSFGVMARALRRPRSHLFVENQTDANDLRAFGIGTDRNTTLLGGAGIDPEHFVPLAPPGNDVPVAAMITRFIQSKGVDVLVKAGELLRQRDVPLQIELHGRPDPGNPEAIPPEDLARWLASGVIKGGQPALDVREVWKNADIAVLPARSREGMPRVMLEAAACARPLVVTDVSGQRDFVRHGQDGLIVGPEDPEALADALSRLAGDLELQKEMGLSARGRVVSAFTEHHVQSRIRTVYQDLAEASPKVGDNYAPI